jgi:hypothetical protein
MPAEAASRFLSRDGLLSVRKISERSFLARHRLPCFFRTISTAPVDRVGRISVAASEPEAARDSMDNAMKFAAFGIGPIMQRFGHALKEGTAITGIDRRRRGAQCVQIFIRQLEHDVATR